MPDVIPDSTSWVTWLGGLIGGAATFVVTWVWKIRGAIEGVKEHGNESLADLENQLRDRINAMERNASQNLESAMRLVADDLSEIKDLVNAQALFIRDNFARRDSVQVMVNEIKAAVDKSMDRIERQMRDDRVERSELMDALRRDYSAVRQSMSTLVERK